MKIRISGWEVDFKEGSIGGVIPQKQPINKGKGGNNKGLKNTRGKK